MFVYEVYLTDCFSFLLQKKLKIGEKLWKSCRFTEVKIHRLYQLQKYIWLLGILSLIVGILYTDRHKTTVYEKGCAGFGFLVFWFFNPTTKHFQHFFLFGRHSHNTKVTLKQREIKATLKHFTNTAGCGKLNATTKC